MKRGEDSEMVSLLRVMSEMLKEVDWRILTEGEAV